MTHLLLVNQKGVQTKVSLFSEPPSEPAGETVLEDEHFSIEVFSPGFQIDLKVGTREYFSNAPGSRETEGYKHVFHLGSNGRFFANHFGLCEISIIDESGQAYYGYVDVLVKQRNAKRARGMLEFLSSRLEDIALGIFRPVPGTATGSHGLKNVNAYPTAFLREAKKLLKGFTESLPGIYHRPKGRLQLHPQLERYNPSAYLGSDAVRWLVSHPDVLVPSQPQPVAIRVNRQSYVPSSIQADRLKLDTDIYENRVLHGLIFDVIKVLLSIEQHYESLIGTLQEPEVIPEELSGYQSFDRLRQDFLIRAHNQALRDCKDLLIKTRTIARDLSQLIPVKHLEQGLPRFSPGFRSSPSYRRLFEHALSWYRLGGVESRPDKYLLSLQTLDQLYEFYCLFQLVDVLREMAPQVSTDDNQASEAPEDTAQSQDFPLTSFKFRLHSTYTVELEYEPQTPLDGDGVIDIHHPLGTSATGTWRPDFIISVRGLNNELHGLAIFDAKYSNFATAKQYRFLDEKVLRYVHGIREGARGGISASLMYLLLPANSHDAKYFEHYHRPPYHIFGERPTLPAIGFVSVTPEADRALREQAELTRLLWRWQSLALRLPMIEELT